ncbi:hypothetical protein IMSAGC004_00358 [Bacteroidaceae bacterium]|nr:hypothetical protein IMSAGC004_00358 [Bacteroidaceae bacterium]
MSLGRLGGVVQAEGLAFEEHAVVVDQHGTVNKFERAFAVILEVADGIEGVGIVSFGLYLEAQFYGLPFGNFVAVWHDFHRERIGLLHVEVVGAGSESENESEEDCPEAEETGGSDAGCADFIQYCIHCFSEF